jgi:hypothetical protein
LLQARVTVVAFEGNQTGSPHLDQLLWFPELKPDNRVAAEPGSEAREHTESNQVGKVHGSSLEGRPER